jgi:FkbM family methyltransferase
MRKIVEVENLFGQIVSTSSETEGAFQRHGGFDIPALLFIRYIGQTTPNITAFDVGANVGNHTVVMAKFFSKVYSFEPRLNIENLLKLNVERNGLSNVVLVPSGLSDKKGNMRLYLDDSGNGGRTTFVADHAINLDKNVDVDVIVGDDYFEIFSKSEIGDVAFIKLDVEGMEAKAILGLSRVIAAHKPIVLMEWNNDATKNSFYELGLFKGLLNEYNCIGLREVEAKELFDKTVFGWFKRKFARIANKNFRLVKFVPSQNYENIVLIHRSKLSTYPMIADFIANS